MPGTKQRGMHFRECCTARRFADITMCATRAGLLAKLSARVVGCVGPTGSCATPAKRVLRLQHPRVSAMHREVHWRRDLLTEGLRLQACEQSSRMLMICLATVETCGRWCKGCLAVMPLCPAGVGLLVIYPMNRTCGLISCRHLRFIPSCSFCGLRGCRFSCCCCCSYCLSSILEGRDLPLAAPSLSSDMRRFARAPVLSLCGLAGLC